MRLTIFLFALLCARPCAAADLRALAEFFRPDPFGGIVAADRQGAAWQERVAMKAARGGYTSFHLVARLGPGESADLSVQLPFTTELYREWFHRHTANGQYYPDALIPLQKSHLKGPADEDNRVPGQSARAFWVDVWIPAEAAPATYQGEAVLTSGSRRNTLPIAVTVTAARVPAEDALTLDHNSYGTSWMLQQYPQTLAHVAEDDAPLYKLIHAYHRIFYEHRGIFHQLGYGHAGKVGPEFAPDLAGVGASKHVASWERFDRHYGPLLDGSAFRDTRRGARPIPSVYLPVNPEWPATFLAWGEPGYAAEFTNVLREMERHFRQKGWTATRFEVFFNHKKRYKGFSWDGDEARFERDSAVLLEYHRLLRQAIPADSPVQIVMRTDTSWTMPQQFEQLAGAVRLWVAGEGMFSWFADWLPRLKQRGDVIWTYGGTPLVSQAAVTITLNPLRSWISGVDGFVRWQTVQPGADPWFAFDGGGETLVYPGERFGLGEPLASIRLKLQRNALQDLALLQGKAASLGRQQLQSAVVSRFNGSQLADWRNRPPALLSKPALEWNNADIEDALQPFEARFANVDPGAWLRVRELALAQDGSER